MFMFTMSIVHVHHFYEWESLRGFRSKGGKKKMELKKERHHRDGRTNKGICRAYSVNGHCETEFRNCTFGVPSLNLGSWWLVSAVFR